jgi:hypothetical protein
VPAPPTLILRVLRAPDGSALARGAAFPVPGPEAVVGRAPDADVVLTDATVSRRHVRLTAGLPVRVEALTRSNGTFVDGVPLSPGAPDEVPHGGRLQLGGVVLALVPLADTDPVLEPLGATARATRAEPVLTIRWDAGQCVARCRGRDLGLTGAAARLLGILAGQPGQIVHRWDLQDELDTPHLAPLATAVRHALLAAVRSGALDVDRVRIRIRAAAIGAGDVADGAPTELVRALVQARRGHGYVLHLAPEDVEVVRV